MEAKVGALVCDPQEVETVRGRPWPRREIGRDIGRDSGEQVAVVLLGVRSHDVLRPRQRTRSEPLTLRMTAPAWSTGVPGSEPEPERTNVVFTRWSVPVDQA